MNISINKKILIKLLKIVSGGVIKNYSSKDEIFSHILLKIINNKIFCISSNDEIEIITYDKILSNINIELILSFKTIYNICKTSSDDSEIIIIKKIKHMEIKSENSLFTIPYPSYNIFPIFSKYKKIKNKISFISNNIKMLFSKTLFSISENDSRCFLNGLLLEIKKDKMYAISSDGHRLSMDSINIKENEINNKFIIPKNTIYKFINTFPNDTNITIYFSDKYIKFLTNNITFTSKLINDNYPDMYKLLNNDSNKFINLNTYIFKSALLKTQTLCNINNKKIKIILNNNNMTIIASNNIEQIITNLKINYEYEMFEIVLNLSYIIDILNVIQSNIIKIIFPDENKIIIKETNSFNGTYLIMPYKL